MLLESIRQELLKLHALLPQSNLVPWAGGTVSVRDQKSGLVVIKPSGVMDQDLRAEDFLALDVTGKVVEGTLKPSADAASHLIIYRHRWDVFAVVQTQTPYATAFAVNGMPIPVYLTAQAEAFGGAVPCAGFGLTGGDEIGKLVLKNIGTSRACLVKNHGVFSIGPTGMDALKASVMVEDIARTAWLARQLGQPEEIPAEMVQKLRSRYTKESGQ